MSVTDAVPRTPPSNPPGGPPRTAPRTAALVAGGGYALLFVLAVFANFFVLEQVTSAGDAASTVARVAESETMFRLALVAFLVVFVVDVVVAWALWVVFRDVHRDLSLLAAWFRLVYTVFLGVAAVALFAVLRLVTGPAAAGRDEQVVLLLDAFAWAWLVGLLCFGVHLVLVGYLVLRSRSAPTVLAVLLGLAGAGYVVDTLANALLRDYADLATVFLLVVAVPAVIGELAFTVWLLLRGGRRPAASVPAPRHADRRIDRDPDRRAGDPADGAGAGAGRTPTA